MGATEVLALVRVVLTGIGEQGIVKNTTLFSVDSFPEMSQRITTRCEYRMLQNEGTKMWTEAVSPLAD
jgi:hypothetical protein